MKKSLSNLLVTALGLALLVYSATRSVDFISATLPPDRQILAWFGLAALDGGLVLWLLFFLSGAKGALQRGIALLMVVTDFLGCVSIFTLDTLLRTGQAGMTAALTPAAIQTAVLALSLVIALNIAAVVGSHLSDQETRRTMAQEEARDTIEDLAIKQISENSQRLAAELAPQVAATWIDDTKAEYQGALSKRAAGSSIGTRIVHEEPGSIGHIRAGGSQERKPYQRQPQGGAPMTPRPKIKVNRPDKTCLNCGKRISPGRAGRRDFCNNACKQAHWRKVHQPVTEANAERNT